MVQRIATFSRDDLRHLQMIRTALLRSIVARNSYGFAFLRLASPLIRNREPVSKTAVAMKPGGFDVYTHAYPFLEKAQTKVMTNVMKYV
jgi:hypothetical protein